MESALICTAHIGLKRGVLRITYLEVSFVLHCIGAAWALEREDTPSAKRTKFAHRWERTKHDCTMSSLKLSCLDHQSSDSLIASLIPPISVIVRTS
jgi:hypothetical protein